MTAQIIAAAIFLSMFILIITDKIERHIVTLVCGALTLVLVFGVCMHSMDSMLEVLNFKHIFTETFWYNPGSETPGSGGINWETIIFIAGMMTMVEGMERAGFFSWLCIAVAQKVKFKVIPIFIMFMITSAVLSMFIDSITVILFLAAVTVELAQQLKFNPVPMIMAEIFCANLGGSATMCGDPPNIIIGTALGYTFMDFLSNTGVIAGISLVCVVIFFYFAFRKELRPQKEDTALSPADYPDPRAMIKDRKSFSISAAIFLAAVVLLVTHAQTGLTVAFIGLLIGTATLITSGRAALSVVKGIDYKTLLFFVGLFIVIGGLESSGVLKLVAKFIESVSGGNIILITVIIIWLSGIASAFVDNIPFAATMIPVIKALSAANGMELHVLSWALALGTDIGGSATPIGASANVVGTSVAAKAGYKISWGKYCKYMAPASIIVLLISTVFIWVRYL